MAQIAVEFTAVYSNGSAAVLSTCFIRHQRWKEGCEDCIVRTHTLVWYVHVYYAHCVCMHGVGVTSRTAVYAYDTHHTIAQKNANVRSMFLSIALCADAHFVLTEAS